MLTINETVDKLYKQPERFGCRRLLPGKVVFYQHSVRIQLYRIGPGSREQAAWDV